MRHPTGWLCMLALSLSLSACAQRSPADTMTAYLNARVNSDSVQLQALACADWEDDAAREADSFRLMNATLDGASCQTASESGGEAVVVCQGTLMTEYNGETREWPLGAYRLIQEDGEWKMCGETQAP